MKRLRQLSISYPEIPIFACLTLGVLLCFFYITVKNDSDVDKITDYYCKADKHIYDDIKTSKRVDSINICSNLKTIYLFTGELKQSKFFLATKYQRFFIVCYTIGIFFIILTAVVTFVVTKKGWDHSNRTRKAFLLTCAFYGLLLTTFPKLFDQELNYKNNFSDYTALSKSQLFIYKRLCPFFDKKDNKLSHIDSTILLNAIDTTTIVLMQHSSIDISIDTKQLEIKTIELSK